VGCRAAAADDDESIRVYFLEELLAYHPSLQDPVLSDSNVTVNSKVRAAAMLLLLTV
jgi:hypothetical protein